MAKENIYEFEEYCLNDIKNTIECYDRYFRGINMNKPIEKWKIYFLRDITKVGESIVFKKNIFDYRSKTKTIKGTIKKKYKNIFMLNDGSIHTWVEYYIGSPRAARISETLISLKNLTKYVPARNEYAFKYSRY